MPILKPKRTSSWAQYTIQLAGRDEFAAKLGKVGVPTSVHYPRTMPDQPAYQEIGRVVSAEVSRQLAETVLSLPFYPDMTDQIQDQVIAAVLAAIWSGARSRGLLFHCGPPTRFELLLHFNWYAIRGRIETEFFSRESISAPGYFQDLSYSS